MIGRMSSLLLFAAPAVLAQPMDMDMDMGSMQGGSAPADARDPHAWSDGVDFTRGDARPMLMDEHRFHAVRVDEFEAVSVDGETIVPFDVEAWLGTTYHRGVIKAEGDFESGDLAEARTELLYSRALAPYWDGQFGIRHDSGDGPDRTWLAAGIAGLAPYRFDLELTAYIGEASRTAFRVDASYDLLLTQRLILEPSFEANFYGRDDTARGIGSGLANIALALRLRYEIRRELAPYLGVERLDEYGDTEKLSRAAGLDSSDTRAVLGLRFWF